MSVQATASATGATGSLTDYDAILREDARKGRRNLFLLGAIALVVIVSAQTTGLLTLQRLLEAPEAIGVLFMDMIPPQFTNWRDWVRPFFDTMAMSVAGTALAVTLSLPLGFLAARNTTPHILVYRATRLLLNMLRSIPELIMGIVFVAAVGFGPLPGVLALGFHSIGMVAKFFAEAIEHVDHRPIEAAQAAGASHFQVIQYAIMPQVLPQIADVTLYRWEYNFRASTVMGMVGAGGIGLELMSSLRLMQYREVAAILLCILVLVTLVDAVGALLRKKLH